MPPPRAMAIAMLDSVTVSMGEDTCGDRGEDMGEDMGEDTWPGQGVRWKDSHQRGLECKFPGESRGKVALLRHEVDVPG